METEFEGAHELFSMLKRHQNHIRVDLDVLLVQIRDDPLNAFDSYKQYMRRQYIEMLLEFVILQ